MAAQDSAASTRVITTTDLAALRDHVAAIIPGGRNPEPSYMSKADALRMTSRL